MSEASGFEGLLFGPGVAGAGLRVAGCWRGDVLALSYGAPALSMQARHLAVDAAGFNAAQVRITWRSAEGDYAYIVDRPRDADMFAKAAPASLATALLSVRTRQGRVASRFRFALLAYGLILALPFILLAAFLMNSGSIAAWAADKVPAEYEAKLGQLVLAQTRVRMRLIDQGPAHAAVAQIGGRLSAGSRFRYQWFIADAPEVNAFAAPGGIIVVNAGLIARTERAEELAGVLAHEIAHVEQRHALTGLFKNAGFGVLLALAIGDWSGTAVGAWAAGMTELKFSRDAEMEADSVGLATLVRAGVDPRPMAQFFERLARQESGPDALSLLATHPSSGQRSEALRKKIDALPAQEYPALAFDWSAVRSSLQAQSAR